jgi:Mrp family chromosome partitioning ATPase
VADTLRRGGAPGKPGSKTDEHNVNTDNTDPEALSKLKSPLPGAAGVVPAGLAAATGAVSTAIPKPSEPPPRTVTAAGLPAVIASPPVPAILPAATLITAAMPAVDSGTTLRPSTLHEDPTTMNVSARAVRERMTQMAQRADPAVGIPDGERPKVWVATHKAPPEPDPRLILVREPDSLRAASFRVIRHRVSERGNPRVIAVTSAGARDGKTTCAANLSLALSEFGRAKVLLLEANLRAPQIAVLFGFLPPECFSVQLQRHRDRPLDPWSIVEAFSPALHVLAVKPGEADRPLLDAPAFAIAIEMLLRVGYDYIVVDTPPVLGSADVNLIEDYVDAVILTARSGRTLGRSLREAIDQLSPRKLLGVTLIDA